MKPRKRPSQSRGFRIAAFTAGLLIFALSYWLGNRYQSPDIPGLTATLLHPPQSLPVVELISDDNRKTLPTDNTDDQWKLLMLGSWDHNQIRILSSSYNRLAEYPDHQKRFKVWLISNTTHVAPEFAVQFRISNGDNDKLQTALGQMPSQIGLYLIDPDGRLSAIFSGIEDPSVIARNFKSIVDYYTP